MREIKFRAWDSKYKKMSSFKSMQNSAVFAIANGLDSDQFIVLPKYENITLMQYTGLKDKNGTEIYEGDILNHHYHKEIGDIRWEEKRATFLLFYTDGLKDGLLSVDSPSYEVIGNIYENPELLSTTTTGSELEK